MSENDKIAEWYNEVVHFQSHTQFQNVLHKFDSMESTSWCGK